MSGKSKSPHLRVAWLLTGFATVALIGVWLWTHGSPASLEDICISIVVCMFALSPVYFTLVDIRMGAYRTERNRLIACLSIAAYILFFYLAETTINKQGRRIHGLGFVAGPLAYFMAYRLTSFLLRRRKKKPSKNVALGRAAKRSP